MNADAASTSLESLRRHLSRLGVSGEPGYDLDLALALLETAEVIVLVLDPDRRIVYFNEYFEELSGFTLAETQGRDWFEICIPKEVEDEGLDQTFRRAIGGDATRRNVHAVIMKDGRRRVVEWNDRVLQGASGETAGLLAIGRDVTISVKTLLDLRRRTEAALGTSLQLLEGTFEVTKVCLAYMTPDFDFVRVNRAYAAADAKVPSDFEGRNHFEMYPNEDNERIFREVRETGVAYSASVKPFEYALNPERGVTHWDWTLTPIKEEDGEVSALVLALQDVTERVQALERLQVSERDLARQLAEKETLLREVHHRVKNNLQVVGSLLYLQSTASHDPSVAQHFEAMQHRVQAMALVHEELYGTEGMDQVDFCGYLEKLVHTLRASFQSSRVETEVLRLGEAPKLDLGVAVSCGLLVSELLTNAFEHAFAEKDEGRIRVGFGSEDGERLRLFVQDDGCGIPAEILRKRETLGLRLVRSLVDQIQGTLETEVEGGTRFVVSWPAS